MSSRSNQEIASELLIADPERLEAGLVALDSDLRLDDDVEIDVLLRDSLGYPVAVLFCGDDVAGELARMAGVAEGLRRGRYLLNRLYHNKGLDPSLRPRFVLLGARFPDSAPRVLDMMTGVEVQAVEYRVVQSSVGRPVLDLSVFHRAGGTVMPSYSRPSSRSTSSRSTSSRRTRPLSSPLPRPARAQRDALADEVEALSGVELESKPTTRPEPARPAKRAAPPAAAATPAEDELELVEDTEPRVSGADQAQALFLRARDSIRALSTHVAESQEQGVTRFTVEGKPLATLQLDTKGLRIGVGSEKKLATVTEEEAFNERLNAIFTLYFEQLGPDRLSA